MQQSVGYVSPLTLISPLHALMRGYRGESALANFITDAVVEHNSDHNFSPIDLPVYNATGLEGLAVSVSINYKDIYQMMPFADQIVLVQMTGQELEQIIRYREYLAINSYLAHGCSYWNGEP